MYIEIKGWGPWLLSNTLYSHKEFTSSSVHTLLEAGPQNGISWLKQGNGARHMPYKNSLKISRNPWKLPNPQAHLLMLALTISPIPPFVVKVQGLILSHSCLPKKIRSSESQERASYTSFASTTRSTYSRSSTRSCILLNSQQVLNMGCAWCCARSPHQDLEHVPHPDRAGGCS